MQDALGKALSSSSLEQGAPLQASGDAKKEESEQGSGGSRDSAASSAESRGKKRTVRKRRRRKRVKVDLQELDGILDAGLKSPLTEDGHQKVKATLHDLLDEEASQRYSTERALALLGKRADPSVSPPEDAPKRKRPGHGRNGVAAFVGARKVFVPIRDVSHGCTCPNCKQGKIYRQQRSNTLLRIKAQAPIEATVYELEQLRCNLCGETFGAKAPDGVGDEKFDASVSAMVAFFKYGLGMPFKRIETMQKSMGVPLPVGTQWKLVQEAVVVARPVYDALVEEAAQADVNHADDTSMKVLEGIVRPEGSKRTGVFTTSMVARGPEHDIALFFTGPQHAGENRADVLAHRDPDLQELVAMGDALARNMPKLKEAIEILEANCLSHARGYAANLVEINPEECAHILIEIGKVYGHDEEARERKLTPQERLELHQRKSGPVMDELKKWMVAQFDEKRAEPNSRLGRTIKYFLKHWEPLTLFLRQAGAPLDNNICERAIKKAVLHRKNALYYRNPKGALAGDIFMSLIHTCELNKVNAFEYLLEMQRHPVEVRNAPKDWMPWNFTNQLARGAPG